MPPAGGARSRLAQLPSPIQEATHAARSRYRYRRTERGPACPANVRPPRELRERYGKIEDDGRQQKTPALFRARGFLLHMAWR